MILNQIPQHKLPRFLRVCKRFHAIGARIMYSNLRLWGRTARCCFAMLATPTELCMSYARLVRRLHFVAEQDRINFLTFPCFADALRQLVNLEFLSLYIHPQSSVMMMRCLIGAGLFLQATHPSLLPKLSAVRMKGSVALLEITRFRAVDDVFYGQPLSLLGLDRVLAIIREHKEPSSIKCLSIKLVADTDMGLVLRAVSSACPSLERLVITQQYEFDNQNFPSVRD